MRSHFPDTSRLAAAGAALVFALLGASCAERPVTKPPASGPPVNLSGYSPAFREGFDDGCRTARGDNRRDEKRYAADTQYAQGWSDGRSICAKR